MRLKKDEQREIRFRVEAAMTNKHKSDWFDTADRMIELYKGQHWPGLPSDEHRITINFAQINADILWSSISYADPEFMIVPRTTAAEEKVTIQRAALTKTWEDIEALLACQRALLDAIVTGLGAAFVGWRYETESKPAIEGVPTRERPDFLPEEGPLPIAIENGGQKMVPPPEEYAEPQMREEVVYDDPIVRRVDPTCIYVDPDHDDLQNLMDARYIIEEYTLPLTDVKADSRLKHTDKLTGIHIMDGRFLSDEKVGKEEGAKRVKLFHYWQREGKVHVIYSDELLEQPLLVEKWPYEYKSYPYVLMPFRFIPNDQEPQGQIEPAETVIKELDRYRTVQLNHDDRYAKGRTAYDANKVSAEGIKALRSGEDGALVEVQGNPNEAFASVPDDTLPADFYASQQGIKADISNIMSIDDWMRGTPDKTRRTKGEVQMMVSRSSVRGQMTQRMFERFCERVGALILNLLQDERFCDRQRWLAISGETDDQGQPVPSVSGTWNATSIAGRSDVRVIVNSTRVQTPEEEQQKWGYLLQSLAPLAQAGQIDLLPMIEEALKSFNVPPQKIKSIVKSGGGQMTQLMQAGQMMQQQMQQMMQAGQQMGQQLQQIAEQVQQLDAMMKQGAIDAKAQQEMALEKQKAELEMSIERQKAQIDIQIKQQEMEHKEQLLNIKAGTQVVQARQQAQLGERKCEMEHQKAQSQMAQSEHLTQVKGEAMKEQAKHKPQPAKNESKRKA